MAGSLLLRLTPGQCASSVRDGLLLQPISMTATKTNTRSRLARDIRVGTAAALAVLVLAVAPATSADPTREEIENARTRLAEMDQRLGLLVEEYNQTQVRLEAAQNRLAVLRAAMERARVARRLAMERLGDAAREAYKNQASNLDLLLSSESFSDLSDRIYFLGLAAQDQEDLATRAEVTTERAGRAADELQLVVARQRELLTSLNQQQAVIEEGIADQQALIDDLEEELRQEILQQRRREAAAARAAASPSPPPSAPAAGTPTAPPPVSGSGAAAAIAAAESVLGVPYVYAGASPQTGFDCSGLTMWAWSHAGVSLPHSSQMQYASLPHVSRDQLQPGDLVFFYNPIHHVGLYVGGGMMIHAPHTGSVVSRVAVYWQYFTGAARPG
jgi:peptidoglycan DL-endopeptidase CwlO